MSGQRLYWQRPAQRERHAHDRSQSQPDPNRGGLWPIVQEQAGASADHDVQAEEDQADPGDPRRAVLSPLDTCHGAAARLSGQAPKQDTAGHHFDDAVEAEGGQQDAMGAEAAANGNQGLDRHPADGDLFDAHPGTCRSCARRRDC